MNASTSGTSASVAGRIVTGIGAEVGRPGRQGSLAGRSGGAFEGGAVVARDAEMKAQIDLLKNFGISDEVTIDETGINGKMSEFNAALGLLQLKRVDEAIEQRRQIADTYLLALKNVRGLRCLVRADESGANHAYFPILIEDEFGCTRDEIYFRMKANDVNARRYFFPLVSSLPPYRRLASAAPENLPVATQAADRVLCLPIYPGLSPADQTRVIEALLQARLSPAWQSAANRSTALHFGRYRRCCGLTCRCL